MIDADDSQQYDLFRALLTRSSRPLRLVYLSIIDNDSHAIAPVICQTINTRRKKVVRLWRQNKNLNISVTHTTADAAYSKNNNSGLRRCERLTESQRARTFKAAPYLSSQPRTVVPVSRIIKLFNKKI